MTGTIKLFKGPSSFGGRAWLAKSDDPEVRELFGTDTIETPFKDSMDAEEVRQRIETLNPQADVEVVEAPHRLPKVASIRDL